MEVTQSRHLVLVFVLSWGLVAEVTADVDESSDDVSPTVEPVWLTDVPAAMGFISAAEVAIVGFFQDLETPIVSIFRSMAQQFQDVTFGISNDSEVLSHYNITKNTICLFRLVDNEQLRVEGEDIEKMDAEKLSRFIQINSLHWVTEYSSMTAFGLFNAAVQIHLLLVMNKASLEYEENMRRFQEAAKLFQGEILFVLVDSGMKENEKVVSYFRLKENQLPALAIYQTVDDKWDSLPKAEVTVEQVCSFYEGFLQGKLLREDRKPEETTPKEEL